jgi:hypothetical protein
MRVLDKLGDVREGEEVCTREEEGEDDQGGGGRSAGYVTELSSRWKGRVEASWGYLPVQDRGRTTRGYVE